MTDLESNPVDDHKINELNKRIEITSNTTGNRYQLKLDKGSGEFERLRISFQLGEPDEVGFNGLSIEALLAVVVDRLKRFQKGPYPCKENAYAIGSIKSALDHLSARYRRLEAEAAAGSAEAAAKAQAEVDAEAKAAQRARWHAEAKAKQLAELEAKERAEFLAKMKAEEDAKAAEGKKE